MSNKKSNFNKENEAKAEEVNEDLGDLEFSPEENNISTDESIILVDEVILDNLVNEIEQDKIDQKENISNTNVRKNWLFDAIANISKNK